MKKIIAACGNDCSQCPRHLPKSKAELQHTAELWLKIGYRDRLVSSEEISCSGCHPENWCRYDIVNCATGKQISNCGECENYPCDKIKKCFEVTESFAPSCKKVCTKEEYDELCKAFFEKEKNLNHIYEVLEKDQNEAK